MGARWYESRTVQGALIGGGALVLAAIITALFSHFDRDRYPPIEIKNLTPTGEEVLARLALAPARQLLDSSAFAAIRRDDLIWNDTIGAAIARPTSYEWGAGTFEPLDDISAEDVAALHWFTDLATRGFQEDTSRGHVAVFGVRLDQPTRITLTADTRIDSTPVGVNPFRDPKYFLGLMRSVVGDRELRKMPVDSLVEGQKDAVRTIDSVLHARIPSNRKIYSGVFVALVTAETLPRNEVVAWLKRPLLDQAVGLVLISTGYPNFQIVDRDRGTVLFSDALRVENALVNGKRTQSLTLNRAGYVVQTGKVVHVVMLQYTSNQPKAVLDELQRYMASVKLRSTSR